MLARVLSAAVPSRGGDNAAQQQQWFLEEVAHVEEAGVSAGRLVVGAGAALAGRENGRRQPPHLAW